jgi:hypothetical protein
LPVGINASEERAVDQTERDLANFSVVETIIDHGDV